MPAANEQKLTDENVNVQLAEASAQKDSEGTTDGDDAVAPAQVALEFKCRQVIKDRMAKKAST